MASKFGGCNCGYGTANTPVVLTRESYAPVRKTETYTAMFCRKCAALFEAAKVEEAKAKEAKAVERYSAAGITAHLDTQIAELVAAVDAWNTHNREDANSTYFAAYGVLNIARNISADMGDLAQIVHAAANRSR